VIEHSVSAGKEQIWTTLSSESDSNTEREQPFAVAVEMSGGHGYSTTRYVGNIKQILKACQAQNASKALALRTDPRTQQH
jgi:hypothetical protein